MESSAMFRIAYRNIGYSRAGNGSIRHGSVHVELTTIISSAQQVTVKYRQAFAANTHGSLWTVIFQHSLSIRWTVYIPVFCIPLLHNILHIVYWVLFYSCIYSCLSCG